MIFEDRGSGPLEEGDILFGVDGEEEEEVVRRVAPAESLIADEVVEEGRPWYGAVTEVVYHSGNLLGSRLDVKSVSKVVVREAPSSHGRLPSSWGWERFEHRYTWTTRLEIPEIMK